MSDLRCFFCGRARSEVARLIAGPTAYICNECVVLCMQILEEEPVEPRTTEGQLLVRFPDGTVTVCEQREPWRDFVVDGEDLQWCPAAGFVRSSTPLVIVTVRRRGVPGPIIGATFPAGTTVTEADARALVRAYGGAARLMQTHAPAPPPRAAIGTNAAEKGAPFAMGLFSDQEATNFLSQQYRVPTVNLDEYEVASEILQIVPQELCEKHNVLPISRAGSSLIVAMADPNNKPVKDELKSATGYDIEPVIASERALRMAIDRYYQRSR